MFLIILFYLFYSHVVLDLLFCQLVLQDVLFVLTFVICVRKTNLELIKTMKIIELTKVTFFVLFCSIYFDRPRTKLLFSRVLRKQIDKRRKKKGVERVYALNNNSFLKKNLLCSGILQRIKICLGSFYLVILIKNQHALTKNLNTGLIFLFLFS